MNDPFAAVIFLDLARSADYGKFRLEVMTLFSKSWAEKGIESNAQEELTSFDLACNEALPGFAFCFTDLRGDEPVLQFP